MTPSKVDLQIGYEKGTLNRLVGNVHTVQMDRLNPNFNLSPDFRSRRIFQHIPKTIPQTLNQQFRKEICSFGNLDASGTRQGSVEFLLAFGPKSHPSAPRPLRFGMADRAGSADFPLLALAFAALSRLPIAGAKIKADP